MNLKNKFHIPVFHHRSSLLHVPPTHSVAGVIPFVIKIMNQCFLLSQDTIQSNSILDSEEIRTSQVEPMKPAKCSESSNPAHVRHSKIEFSRRLMAIS